jgi:hypothetical protein
MLENPLDPNPRSQILENLIDPDPGSNEDRNTLKNRIRREKGNKKAVLWIRTYWFQCRIRYGSGSRVLMTKKWEKFTAKKMLYFFDQKLQLLMHRPP